MRRDPVAAAPLQLLARGPRGGHRGTPLVDRPREGGGGGPPPPRGGPARRAPGRARHRPRWRRSAWRLPRRPRTRSSTRSMTERARATSSCQPSWLVTSACASSSLTTAPGCDHGPTVQASGSACPSSIISPTKSRSSRAQRAGPRSGCISGLRPRRGCERDRSSRFAITSLPDTIADRGLRTYGHGRLDSLQEVPLPHSDTGERLTPVLDFPFRDGLAVQAIRVDYEPGGFTRQTHRPPAGAYVYGIEGSVMFGLAGREPVVVKAGESVYEPPGALHSVSRNASDDQPASLIAFFVLGEGESSTVYDHD